jgi:tetratricopeptide (TPR) repeat protein
MDNPLDGRPYLDEALSLSEKLKFENGKLWTLSYLGNVYRITGNTAKALEYLFTGLSLADKLNNAERRPIILNTIGNCYKTEGQNAKAIEYYFKALEIEVQKKFELGQTRCFYNLGASYTGQGDSALKENNISYADSRYKIALDYFDKSLVLSEKLNQKHGIVLNYNTMGNIQKSLGNFEKASEFFNKSLTVAKELEDPESIGIAMFNIGDVMVKKVSKANRTERLAVYRKALPFFENSYQACLDLGDMNGRVESLIPLYSFTDSLGDRGKAFEYYKEYIHYRDSIYNKENTEKAVRAEMNFELEKKEAEARLVQERAASENRKQKLVIYFVIGILLLVLIFSVIVLRSYQQKRKANIEITKQKHIIEDKQRAILDSIHYAKRIQTAFLTSEKYISRELDKLKR